MASSLAILLGCFMKSSCQRTGEWAYTCVHVNERILVYERTCEWEHTCVCYSVHVNERRPIYVYERACEWAYMWISVNEIIMWMKRFALYKIFNRFLNIEDFVLDTDQKAHVSSPHYISLFCTHSALYTISLPPYLTSSISVSVCVCLFTCLFVCLSSLSLSPSLSLSLSYSLSLSCGGACFFKGGAKEQWAASRNKDAVI